MVMEASVKGFNNIEDNRERWGEKERERERERQTDRERNNKETPEKQNINNITSLPLLKFNG